MTTIWKFPIPVRDEPVLTMPAGAHVLAVSVQDAVPMLWAIVDPDRPTEERTFYVRGTGHTLGDAEGHPHVGSFQLAHGAFVGHVFDGGSR